MLGTSIFIAALSVGSPEVEIRTSAEISTSVNRFALEAIVFEIAKAKLGRRCKPLALDCSGADRTELAIGVLSKANDPDSNKSALALASLKLDAAGSQLTSELLVAKFRSEKALLKFDDYRQLQTTCLNLAQAVFGRHKTLAGVSTDDICRSESEIADYLNELKSLIPELN
jgi:hypothetical protein